MGLRASYVENHCISGCARIHTHGYKRYNPLYPFIPVYPFLYSCSWSFYLQIPAYNEGKSILHNYYTIPFYCLQLPLEFSAKTKVVIFRFIFSQTLFLKVLKRIKWGKITRVFCLFQKVLFNSQQTMLRIFKHFRWKTWHNDCLKFQRQMQAFCKM